MKHLSNLALRLPSPDHREPEEMSGNLPTQRPEADPPQADPRQDFAQLLARYKRAGYEAVEHWNQTHRT